MAITAYLPESVSINSNPQSGSSQDQTAESVLGLRSRQSSLVEHECVYQAFLLRSVVIVDDEETIQAMYAEREDRHCRNGRCMAVVGGSEEWCCKVWGIFKDIPAPCWKYSNL